MKKLHLICNAHLDPAWLWRWNEGLAEAISTFRVAADICEKHDGFVFNHNEALLYEWVEEHEPQLFERIKKLVSEGKWTIIGGWYLQPDCVMTSGESLLSQIDLGREYFRTKFGVEPKTAINFDSFGHSRGLVQILNKKGYDSYIVMRPGKIKGDFIWEGYDGSEIILHSTYSSYSSLKGEGAKKVRDFLEKDYQDTNLLLWGVGNHGGGPSKIDVEEINELIKESKVEILHSSPEKYFADVDKKAIDRFNESLISWGVGCYTSMVRIKQANRHLENRLALTEKAMSYAEATGKVQFDYEELKKAKKALAFCQFHDILPGSGIKAVEEDGLRTLSYGEEIVDRLYTKAFFKLCAGQKEANDGEIPLLVFNPHPYEIETELEVGFMLQNQNWNEDEKTCIKVYDEDGYLVPTQDEKPDCTFNLDWINKVSFRAKLAPSSVSRFDCRLTVFKKKDIPIKEYKGNFITVENDRMKVQISKKTGLIERYEVDGKSLIKNSGVIEVYKDNEDPWGMRVDSFADCIGAFSLMSNRKANGFVGYPKEKFANVKVVEDGDVRMKIQAFFNYKKSNAVIEYTIPKMGTYIDVNITIYSNEPNVMLKYKLDTNFSGTPYGQTAFGSETLYNDEKEAVYHKWCGIKSNENNLYVLNKGTYGGSFTNNTIKLSLLRTPVYSAHPIRQRQLVPHNRFLNHIDMGERQFFFRITTEENVDKQAQIFNEEPQIISFFPSGEGEKMGSFITIDNDNVILSSLRHKDDGYELTLFNTIDNETNATISIPALEKQINISFGKSEFKIIKV